MYIDMGRMVEDVFRQFKVKHRRNVTWFATQLNCDRRNIYDIFKRTTIDTQLLAQISLVLDHNFFQDIAEIIEPRLNHIKPDPKSGLSFLYPTFDLQTLLKSCVIGLKNYLCAVIC